MFLLNIHLKANLLMLVTTASGLINNDGRFVADVAGNYLVTASVGNITNSQALNVYERNIKRDVVKVGTGLVNDKHTSDFWVFEGVDGRDYAVTGTWGADGTSYFWDVTDPANILKIDSVQVDARTVNDVKVSEDGKICIISREGASNRKNGIIIIDVSIKKESYLDISEGFPDDHVQHIRLLKMVYELGIERVKVGFYGCSLHHKILCYPCPKFVRYVFSQLTCLKQECTHLQNSFRGC